MLQGHQSQVLGLLLAVEPRALHMLPECTQHCFVPSPRLFRDVIMGLLVGPAPTELAPSSAGRMASGFFCLSESFVKGFSCMVTSLQPLDCSGTAGLLVLEETPSLQTGVSISRSGRTQCW